MIWRYPRELSSELRQFLKDNGCNYIQAVRVQPESFCEELNCHNNVSDYVTLRGGSPVYGFDVLESDFCYQIINHTIVRTSHGDLLDITPYRYSRQFTIFAFKETQSADYSVSNKYYPLLEKYTKKYQEGDDVYCVYFLKDPREDVPFYVGKGNGSRAQQHLWNISREHNEYKTNKINKIRQAGLEPEIVYVAENIDSEELAYDIEETLIKYYGRKGYEDNGILTNVCVNSR